MGVLHGRMKIRIFGLHGRMKIRIFGPHGRMKIRIFGPHDRMKIRMTAYSDRICGRMVKTAWKNRMGVLSTAADRIRICGRICGPCGRILKHCK